MKKDSEFWRKGRERSLTSTQKRLSAQEIWDEGLGALVLKKEIFGLKGAELQQHNQLLARYRNLRKFEEAQNRT